MGDNLLALDLSTSSLHCLVTDAKGRPLASSDSEIRLQPPPDGPDLARELDSQSLMEAARRVVVQCLKEAKISPQDIKAIGVTGQRQGIALLDGDGKELLLSPNTDLRASFEGLALEERWGATVRQITGHFPLLLLAPAKVAWVRENRPDIFQNLGHLLTLPAWLVYRLTGRTVCEPTLAAAAGLLDVASHERPATLLSKFGVPMVSLPGLVKPGTVAGALAEMVAKSWGLPPGTPVALAGADTQCGLLGMGLIEVAQTGVVAGWSCAAQTLTEQPCYDAELNCWTGCYPMDRLWTLEANLGDAGNAHRWLKEMILGKEMSWEYADSLAEGIDPGSGGVSCFLGPSPVSAAKARLKKGAISFPIPLSYQESSPGQILHAFYESLAYSLKANIEGMEKVTGRSSKTLHIGGGMAQSTVLMKVIADALGRPVRRSTSPNVSALGASMAAAVASGLYSSLADAARGMVSSFELLEPETVRTLEYQDLSKQWKLLYQRIQDN